MTGHCVFAGCDELAEKKVEATYTIPTGDQPWPTVQGSFDLCSAHYEYLTRGALDGLSFAVPPVQRARPLSLPPEHPLANTVERIRLQTSPHLWPDLDALVEAIAPPKPEPETMDAEEYAEYIRSGYRVDKALPTAADYEKAIRALVAEGTLDQTHLTQFDIRGTE